MHKGVHDNQGFPSKWMEESTRIFKWHAHRPTHFTRTCTDMTLPLSHLRKKKWEEMDWGFLQKMPCFVWAQGGFFHETNLEIVYLQISPPPLHCAGLTDFPATSQMKPMASVILGAASHIRDYWKEFFLLLHSFVFLFFLVFIFSFSCQYFISFSNDHNKQKPDTFKFVLTLKVLCV